MTSLLWGWGGPCYGWSPVICSSAMKRSHLSSHYRLMRSRRSSESRRVVHNAKPSWTKGLQHIASLAKGATVKNRYSWQTSGDKQVMEAMTHGVEGLACKDLGVIIAYHTRVTLSTMTTVAGNASQPFSLIGILCSTIQK